SVPHSPEWDFGTNEFTVEFWVNFRRINATQSFLGHTPGWGSYIPKWIFWLNGGILQILVDGPTAPYGGHQLGNIPFSPTLNRFYHMAVARRGDVFVFYLDGVVAGAVTNSVSLPSVSAPLKLGQVEVGTFLDGVLDEVAIYNRGLLTTEIKAIYDAQSAGKCAILAAPTIVSQPQSQTVVGGGSALFTVSATGTRPFSYQWQFNESALVGATNAFFILTNAQAGDAGNYKVMVSNVYGTAASSNANISIVILGPNLFDDFDPGIDSPQWSAFGGTVLATNYGGVVSGNNSLWFGGTGSRFAATRALNTVGGGTIGYYLRLASGTNSTWERADLPGEGVVLEYSMDGGTQWTGITTNNTSTFTNWTPQQFQIPAGAQSASTLFRWRQLANSGAPYDHWALDDISIQTFTNSVAPVILSGPAGRAAVAGESVSFAVTASGTAPLRYQWRFNGTDMVGATNASLILNSVQLADTGSFSVVVSNTVGTATSSNAVLTVTAPVCVPAPAGLVAWWSAEGNAVDVVGGNNGQAFGPVAYTSGKAGQAFLFNGSSSYVQVPSSAALKTAGPFSVEAWVYYDRIPSNACAIAVKGPDGEVPLDWDFEIHSLRKLRANLNINGSWVNLTCATTLATNTWHHVAMVYDGSALRCYLNGVQDGLLGVSGAVQTSDNPVRIGAYAPVNGQGSWNFFSGGIDELSLYSRALTAAEVAGIYSARGAGKCGVTPTLAITSQPQDQSVTVGGNASFSVGVSGTPPIAYQWRLNGTNLAGATSATLALTNVQFAQAGGYSVVVTNVAGTVTSSNATLTVSAALVRSGIIYLNNYDAGSFSGAPVFLFNTSTLAPSDTRVQVLGGPLGGPLSPIISEVTRTNVFPVGGSGDPGYFDAGYGYAGVPDNSPAMIQVLAWRGAGSYAAATVRGSALFTNMTGQSSTGTPPSPPAPAILEMPSIVMQSTTTAAPAITVQPQGGTIIGGNSAMFGVVATGSPAVSYQWRYNGADIPGATNANLTLPNAQDAHAGSYTVFISNTAGNILSDPAVLTVRYLLAVTATPGGTVTKNPASSNYALGTVVELTAAPDAGFAFTGWGGDATGTGNPLNVTISTNKFITATFVENVPPVVTITSPVSGNATGSQTFLAGTVSDNVGVVSARWVRDGQPAGGLILSNGTFRVDPLTLARGTNVFRVIAADAAGNEGFAQVTVVYAPPRVLAVVNPAAEQEGREITVPVELTSPGDVAGMSFVLRYDAAYLKEPELKWASAAASALEQVNLSVPGEVRATFALPAITVRAGTEEIARVTFRARSVPTNLTTALTLEVSDVSDASGNPIAGGVDVEDGSASLLVRKLTGDNNANDRLDTGDATIIQRMLAGLEPVRSWDVTGNDLNATTTLDSGDVIKVMRAVVKLDSQPAPAASSATSVKPKAQKTAADVVIYAGNQSGSGGNTVPPIPLDLLDPSASASPVELAVVSPNGLRGLAGELVTVQVLVSNVQAQLAGASFTLDYPTNALRLVDASSHQPGSLVSGDTFALWNVEPGQTDFAAQSGRVNAGMSSGTGWPAATNGALAQFTFQVQPGAASQYRWPLVLSAVRLTTADGYSERPAGDAQMYFIGRNAVPANLGSGGGTAPRLNGGQFSFGLGGELGVPYLIEVSANLRDWVPLQTVTNVTGSLPFNDPGATNATQRYYRARQLE
ncbi:MAG: immunoglobulin domain-containing protein, partial [Verrucomicrobia bacterium]|nr:immunoglobulin domain-containing protein [Verrucomicrobiota bacterium]